MKFTNEQLRSLINMKQVGTSYPYNTGDKKKIENYIHNLFNSFKQSNQVDCLGDFDHYGSGYASYVEIFCYKKDRSSVLSQDYDTENDVTLTEMEGFFVYISRLAPVAIFGGKDEVTIFTSKDGSRIGSHTFLSSERVNILPAGFEYESSEIKNKLIEAGYTLLEKDYLEQKLPFEAEIPTILTLLDFGDEYQIWDAIFYWSD